MVPTLYSKKVEKEDNDFEELKKIAFIEGLPSQKSNPEGLKEVLNEQLIPQTIAEKLKISGRELYDVVSPFSLVFISMITESTHDRAVMWAHTLNEIYKELKGTITIKDINSYFPSGLPSKLAYDALWKAYQKELNDDNFWK